jgi:SAM-dependent methyltransferase
MSTYESMRRVALEVLPPFISRNISRHIVTRLNKDNSTASPAHSYRYISTLDELDALIREADIAGSQSDDELRRVITSFEYVITQPMPADPFSQAYREAQMNLYKSIAGRDGYLPLRDEVTQFDLEAARRVWFPFSTHSCATVGEQLMIQGFAIKHMNLKPGSRIIEFGPGWGNTTVALAQMGHQVCAVDVFQGFVDLINFRARQVGVEIETHQSDMLDFEAGDKADAVLFFESFHHCSDHQLMLQRLHTLVKDTGVVIFAGEPINETKQAWGPRLDGMAVWSMRKFGWLELGFMPSYFMQALARYGWQGQIVRSLDCPYNSVVVARKSQAS